MFRLDLSDQEHELLKGIVEERLGILKEEIRHSDTFHFRDDLKKERALVSELNERLGASAGRVCGRGRGQYYAGPIESVTVLHLLL